MTRPRCPRCAEKSEFLKRLSNENQRLKERNLELTEALEWFQEPIQKETTMSDDGRIASAKELLKVERQIKRAGEKLAELEAQKAALLAALGRAT